MLVQHLLQSELSETQFLHFPAEFELLMFPVAFRIMSTPFYVVPWLLSSVSPFTSLARLLLCPGCPPPPSPNPRQLPPAYPVVQELLYHHVFTLTGCPTPPAPAGLPHLPWLPVWLCLPLAALRLPALSVGLSTPLCVSWLVCALQKLRQYLWSPRVSAVASGSHRVGCLWEARRERTKESWPDLKVHVFLRPPQPSPPLHHHHCIPSCPGWRVMGWLPE